MSFTPARLPEGLDYFQRVLGERMVRIEQLYDGSLDLSDIALMNAVIAVREENERRARKAAESARR